MKIELWVIGKTNEAYLETGIAIFEKRVKRHLPFALTVLPDVKLKTTDGVLLKTEEGKMLLPKISPDDFLALLDENGETFASEPFAAWLERRLAASDRRLIFLIGGAFGFSPDVYARANARISLSRLTFSHQLARLVFMEQLYRGMTILKNEPYHNA